MHELIKKHHELIKKWEKLSKDPEILAKCEENHRRLSRVSFEKLYTPFNI